MRQELAVSSRHGIPIDPMHSKIVEAFLMLLVHMVEHCLDVYKRQAINASTPNGLTSQTSLTLIALSKMCIRDRINITPSKITSKPETLDR